VSLSRGHAASTPPLVVVALARFSGLSNGHELSILDGTPFLVVARATVDLAGEVNTGIHDAGRMRGGAQTGERSELFMLFIIYLMSDDERSFSLWHTNQWQTGQP